MENSDSVQCFRCKRDVSPEASEEPPYVHLRCRFYVVDFHPEGNDDIRFAHYLVRSVLKTKFGNLPKLTWINREHLPPDPWMPSMLWAAKKDLDDANVPYMVLPALPNEVPHHFVPKVLVPRGMRSMTGIENTMFFEPEYQHFVNRETLLSLSRYLIKNPPLNPDGYRQLMDPIFQLDFYHDSETEEETEEETETDEKS